jgi:multisubunit Na+/H+ antiporter MnhC subunit
MAALLTVSVYPKGGFTAWVIVSLIWLFVGLAMVGIYPLWEARNGIKKVSILSLSQAGAELLQVINGISADIIRRRS